VTKTPEASESGQAMTEFLLVIAALVFALFFPYLHGQSAVALLLHSLMACFRARSFLLSIL